MSFLLVASNSRADCYSVYQAKIKNIEEQEYRAQWANIAFAIFGHSAYGQHDFAQMNSAADEFKQTLQLMKDAEEENLEALKELQEAVASATQMGLTQLQQMITKANSNGSLCPNGQPMKYTQFVNALMQGSFSE